MENALLITPADCLSSALICWYAPDSRAVAVTTPWVALVNGEKPRIKTAWNGDRCELSRFWEGGEFVLNILDDHSLAVVRRLVDKGLVCMDVSQDLGQDTLSGRDVTAPRLTACSVQLECRNGHITRNEFSADLSGEVVLVHHQRHSFNPRELASVCGRNPLVTLKPR